MAAFSFSSNSGLRWKKGMAASCSSVTPIRFDEAM
jgi:hypothetical protein